MNFYNIFKNRKSVLTLAHAAVYVSLHIVIFNQSVAKPRRLSGEKLKVAKIKIDFLLENHLPFQQQSMSQSKSFSALKNWRLKNLSQD